MNAVTDNTASSSSYSTPSFSSSSVKQEQTYEQNISPSNILLVRREPFEYGLLPLPSLIFSDPVSSLQALRNKVMCSNLAETMNVANITITSQGIAQILDLSDEEAQLVLETLISVRQDSKLDNTVLPSSSSPIDEEKHVSFDDLLLFLYIQNYKKPPIRPHKDAASVADIWPSSTSAFDGSMPSLSPLQVRTGRKNAPTQADDEAHQLSYVQKHLSMLLSLLADTSSEGDSGSLVLSLEQFNHIGFLLKSEDQSSEVLPLSQKAPFFANSDPDMPAAPVPLQTVVSWVLEHIHSSSDRPKEKLKEKGQYGEADDINMVDACLNTTALSANDGLVSTGSKYTNICGGDLTSVDGITKASILKDEKDINRGSVKIVNCHDAVVYILAPMKYASVYGCSDSIIILGAVEKVVRIEHCERVQLIVATMRIRITNCRECIFYMAVNQKPLIIGENHNLQVAPYNTFYPKLETHLAQVGINPSVNKWDKFLTLGVMDPHDSLPHAAGVADVQAEDASLLPPDRYTNFVIPKWNDTELNHQPRTEANPFILPKAYLAAQQQKNKAVESLRQTLRNASIDDSRRQDLSQAIHVHFREWLHASGNIRQLYDFKDSA